MSQIKGDEVEVEFSLDLGRTYQKLGTAVDFYIIDENLDADSTPKGLQAHGPFTYMLLPTKTRKRKERQSKPFWARKENGA